MASNAAAWQIVTAAIAGSSLTAVAAEIGVGDRDLLEYTRGITLAAAPAERLRLWAASRLPSELVPDLNPGRRGHAAAEEPEPTGDEEDEQDRSDTDEAEEEWGFDPDETEQDWGFETEAAEPGWGFTRGGEPDERLPEPRRRAPRVRASERRSTPPDHAQDTPAGLHQGADHERSGLDEGEAEQRAEKRGASLGSSSRPESLPDNAQDKPPRPRRSTSGETTNPAASSLPDAEELERIRDHARRRIDNTSEREVQLEVGPEFTVAALRNFLSGNRLYRVNRERLLTWYKRSIAGAPLADTTTTPWRAVPADILRAYFTTEVKRLRSFRAIRRATGISIKAIQTFLEGTTETQDRVLRPLALYYLAKGGVNSEPAPDRPCESARPRDAGRERSPRGASTRPRSRPQNEGEQKRRPIASLEELRSYFTEECSRVGKASVVRACDVSHRSLNRFLNEGVMPRRRVRHALLDYYHRKEGKLSDPRPPEPTKQQEPNTADDSDAPWRRISSATLRTWYAEESTRVRSRPAVARAAGVGVNTLSRFITAQAATSEAIQRVLAAYYLSRSGELSDPDNPTIRIEHRPRERRTETRSYSFPFPAEEIRNYVRARAERASMRVIHAEIRADVGLADETVSGFLHETRLPTEKSAQKLLAWYSQATIRSPITDSAKRRVPVDELHRFFTDAVARGPIEWVAEITAVSVAALENFLAKRGRLQLRTHRNLQVYYLARKGVPADPPANVKSGEAGLAGPTPEDEQINAIRAYARLRAAAKTARVIADEIGINFSTFYNFLRGNKPIPRIREKLELWYERDSATTDGRTLREQLAEPATAATAEYAITDEKLRAFYQAAVTRGTATSITIALAARIAPTDLELFLKHGRATNESLERLRDYHATYAIKKAAALDALLEDLDGYVRTRARRRILSALARGYQEAGGAPAGWLEFLIAQPL
jgi:hypothetical protein